MESLLLRAIQTPVRSIFDQLSVFRQIACLVSAENYMRQVYLCKQSPSLSSCSLFCEFQIQFGRKPMLKEFIQYVFRPCNENCDYIIPIDEAIKITEHLFIEYGIIAHCRLVYFCYNYLQFEQRYPTDNEIHDELVVQYEQNSVTNDSAVTQLMNQDIEEYWNRKTSNIDCSLLKKEVAQEEKNPCCICQELIEDGQVLIRLPCNHIFHSESNENCMGIEPWLKKVASCPLCKQKCKVTNDHDSKESDSDNEEEIIHTMEQQQPNDNDSNYDSHSSNDSLD